MMPIVSTREAPPVAGEFYDSECKSPPIRGTAVDLFKYRALVALLVRRNLTVQYKRSVLGVAWTVLYPLLTTLVMWAVFSHLFRFKIPGQVPYLVYLLSGILAVTFFQQGLTMTAASMVGSASMLTKVYVPPIVFAVSAACTGAVNFLFGLVPLIIFQLALGVGVSWTIIAMPIPLLMMLAMVAGLGLFLATLAIKFDDVLNFVNVMLVLVGYVTPTFFPVSIVSAPYRKYFYLNPLYSYIQIFRYLEYGGTRPIWLAFVIVALTGVVGLGVGVTVFVKRWPTLVALL